MKVLRLAVGERLALAMLMAEGDTVSATPDDGMEVDEYQRTLSKNLVARIRQLQDDAVFQRLVDAVKAHPPLHSALLEKINSQQVIELQVQNGIKASLSNGSLDIDFVDFKPGDYCIVPEEKLALALTFRLMQELTEAPTNSLNEARTLYKDIVDDGSGAKLRALVESIEAKYRGGSRLGGGALLRLMETLITSQAFAARDVGPMLGSGELVFRKFGGSPPL